MNSIPASLRNVDVYYFRKTTELLDYTGIYSTKEFLNADLRLMYFSHLLTPLLHLYVTVFDDSYPALQGTSLFVCFSDFFLILGNLYFELCKHVCALT